MSGNKTIVYDPNPIDLELEALGSIGVDGMDIKELASPETVRFLFHNQRVAHARLKLSEKQLTSLQNENVNLKRDRESLRIRVAKRYERDKITWLEIPISILSGFSINMLTIKFSDGVGWVLLIISIIMLLFLRGSHLFTRDANNNSEEI